MMVEWADQVNTVRPGDLPELRAHLLREWGPGGLLSTSALLRKAAGAQDNGPPVTLSGEWDVVKDMNWERRTIDRASLWWIASDMVDVLLTAARSIPDDVLPSDLEPLAPYGLVVLEKPWIGTSVDRVGDLRVDGFAWGPVTLPPLREGDDPHNGVPGVSVAAYSTLTPGEYPDATPFNNRVWAWLGRSDWPMRDAISVAPWINMSDQQIASFVEDRRVLVALTTLLAHGGIATTHVTTPSRHVQRRLARTNAVASGDQAVRVVTLRTVRRPAPDGTEKSKIEHDHRWMVGAATGGFWRRQPYGPGRSLRRLQWIMPFVAGPEDKPLRVPETVHAWRR